MAVGTFNPDGAGSEWAIMDAEAYRNQLAPWLGDGHAGWLDSHSKPGQTPLVMCVAQPLYEAFLAREFWRGMAQLAVGLTHARRGNRIGAARLLTRAADRIEPYATLAPHAVPVAELAVWARMLADRIHRADGDVPEDALSPRMTR